MAVAPRLFLDAALAVVLLAAVAATATAAAPAPPVRCTEFFAGEPDTLNYDPAEKVINLAGYATMRDEQIGANEDGTVKRGKYLYPVLAKAALYLFTHGDDLEKPVLEPPASLAPWGYHFFFVDECTAMDEATCGDVYTMQAMRELYLGEGSRMPVRAFVGGSRYTVFAAKLASVLGIANIGFFDFGQSLADKGHVTGFPFFARGNVNGEGLWKVSMAIIHELNYTRVNFWHTDESEPLESKDSVMEIGANYSMLIATSLVPNGEHIATPPTPGSDTEIGYQAIVMAAKLANAHVHLVSIGTSAPHYDFVHYCALYGLVGKGHFWLGSRFLPKYYHSEYIFVLQTIFPVIGVDSEYAYFPAFDGYLEIYPKSVGELWDSAFLPWWMSLGATRSQLFEPWIMDLLPETSYSDEDSANDFFTQYESATWFDDIWSVLLATNSLLLEVGENFTNKQLFDRIMQTDFIGLTGRFRLDSDGERKLPFMLREYQRCFGNEANATGNESNAPESSGDPRRLHRLRFGGAAGAAAERLLRAGDGAGDGAVLGCMQDEACVMRLLSAVGDAGNQSNSSSSPTASPSPAAPSPPSSPSPTPPPFPAIGEGVIVGQYEDGRVDWFEPLRFFGCTSQPPPDLDLPCEPGKFYERTDGVCLSCEAGRFSMEVGQSACAGCLPGSFAATASQSQCLACPMGKFSNTNGATTCQECEPGTFMDLVQQSECLDCDPGTYAEAASQSLCLECPMGNFSNTSRSTRCQECEPGSFMDMIGQSECRLCTEGKYSPMRGQEDCIDCDLGSFSSVPGSTKCHLCEGAHVLTRYPASTSDSDCGCLEGFYTAGEGCKPCKEGMECPFGSDVSQWLAVKDLSLGNVSAYSKLGGSFPLLLPKHWSSPDEPTEVFQCSSEDRCPGGVPGNCSGNLEARNCEHCKEGFAWVGSKCQECEDYEGSFAIFPFLPLLALPIILILMYLMSRSGVESWDSWTKKISLIVFVLLNHYQTLNLLKDTAAVFPGPVSGTFEMWSILNDGLSIFRIVCNGFIGFGPAMILRASVPAVLAVFAIILTLCSKLLAKVTNKSHLAMDKDRMFNVLMSVLYSFFNAVAAMSLSLFKCQSNPNGKRTLTADLSIICYEEGEWMSLLVVGILSTLVYCVGCGALFFYIIIKALEHFPDPGFQRRWTFLFVKYRADVWWWGLVFLAKGITVNLGFVIFAMPIQQLYFNLAVLLLYTILIVQFQPYRAIYGSWIEVISGIDLVLIIAFLASYVGAENFEDEIGTAVVSCSWLPNAVAAPCIAFLAYKGLIADKNANTEGHTKLLRRIREVSWMICRLEDTSFEDFFFGRLGEHERDNVLGAVRLLEAELMGANSKRIVTEVGRLPSDNVSSISASQKTAKVGQLVGKGTPCDRRTPMPGEIVFPRGGEKIATDVNGNEEAWLLRNAEPGIVVAIDDNGDFSVRNPDGRESGWLHRSEFVFWGPKDEVEDAYPHRSTTIVDKRLKRPTVIRAEARHSANDGVYAMNTNASMQSFATASSMGPAPTAASTLSLPKTLNQGDVYTQGVVHSEFV